MPAALGEGAVRTAFFHFHDGPAYSFGKHRFMLLSSVDRKTDRQMDRKADWPLKFIWNNPNSYKEQLKYVHLIIQLDDG